GCQAGDQEFAWKCRRNDVVGSGAVDENDVRLRITGAAGGGEVGVDASQVGAGQVVDGQEVGSTQGVEGKVLHVVEVQDDAADVAREAHARAVGRDVKTFTDVGAVKE